LGGPLHCGGVINNVGLIQYVPKSIQISKLKLVLKCWSLILKKKRKLMITLIIDNCFMVKARSRNLLNKIWWTWKEVIQEKIAKSCRFSQVKNSYRKDWWIYKYKTKKIWVRRRQQDMRKSQMLLNWWIKLKPLLKVIETKINGVHILNQLKIKTEANFRVAVPFNLEAFTEAKLASSGYHLLKKKIRVFKNCQA